MIETLEPVSDEERPWGKGLDILIEIPGRIVTVTVQWMKSYN